MRVLGVSVPLLCLHWHFVVTVLCMVNYVVYIRVRVDNADICSAYLAFSVIGIACYGAVAAPLFVYAYKYADSAMHQLARLQLGIAVMFGSSSLPLCIIELVILLTSGNELHHILDAIVFIVQCLATVVGGAVTWFAYMRLVARRVHLRFCYQRYITSLDDVGAAHRRRRRDGDAPRVVVVKPPHADQPAFI